MDIAINKKVYEDVRKVILDKEDDLINISFEESGNNYLISFSFTGNPRNLIISIKE